MSWWSKLRRKDVRSMILFPLLLIVITIIPIIFWEELIAIFSSAEVIIATVERLGVWGVLGFIAVQTIQVTFFIIPGNIVQAAGGYLFNVPLGTLYSVIGITLGTLVNYFIGYTLGTPFVKRIVKENTYATISSLTNSVRASLAMFVFFLIPGVPKDLAVFAAGSMRVNLRMFLLISMVGRLPAVVGSVAIGTSISNERWVLASIIGAIAILGCMCGIIFRKSLQRRLVEK